MTALENQASSTPFGAHEYYSSIVNPHFRWFDSAVEEAAFLASAEYRDGDWKQTELWCCCACIPDTPVAVPIGQELVKNLKKGDAILAGTVTMSNHGVSVHWRESQAAQAGELTDPADDKAVLINFGAGQNIIVSRYQLMMTAGGKLKQALRLSLGDRLMSKTGAPVTINEIKLGDLKGPRCHIGTNQKFEQNADGHLLAISGIILADYVLQEHRTELPDTLVEDAVV